MKFAANFAAVLWIWLIAFYVIFNFIHNHGRLTTGNVIVVMIATWSGAAIFGYRLLRRPRGEPRQPNAPLVPDKSNPAHRDSN